MGIVILIFAFLFIHSEGLWSAEFHVYSLPGEDIEANPRIQDGDSDGIARVDMGAFEYLIPEEQIENLIEDVDDLLETGELNRGQANALIQILNKALQGLAAGNTTSACKQLGAFMNQVNAYISSGLLSPEDGQVFIDAANRLISELCV